MALGHVLPLIDADNADFWGSGVDGQLRIQRCRHCELWIHPPGPVCRRCHSRQISPQTVSGRGVVFAYTVNYHRWRPDMDVPFTIAMVELVEQRHLRVTSQIVDCSPDDVFSGMPVQVRFVSVDDVWLPLFSPAPRVLPAGPRS